jgi:hypothetical protein
MKHQPPVMHTTNSQQSSRQQPHPPPHRQPARAPAHRPQARQIGKIDPLAQRKHRPLSEQPHTPSKRRKPAIPQITVKKEQPSTPTEKVQPQADIPANEIRDELKNRAEVRKAIVLREILGPPIALRQQQ